MIDVDFRVFMSKGVYACLIAGLWVIEPASTKARVPEGAAAAEPIKRPDALVVVSRICRAGERASAPAPRRIPKEVPRVWWSLFVLWRA